MPRTQLMEKRSYDAQDLDMPVVCPAGERIGERLDGPACLCRIEGSVITAARDASSLALLCMGDNELCPTWRAAREMEWQNESVSQLTAASGLRRNFGMDDVQEMNERLEGGDREGAHEIARRIQESRREQGLRDVSKG